jgi:hypothetical protein
MQNGVKIITIENWNEPDDRALPLEAKSGQGLIELILEPKLDNSVPEDIIEMFEVARSAIVYGYYYYPLYTLGAEQIYRVGESAVRHKLDSIKIKNNTQKFANCIDLLKDNLCIDMISYNRWDSVRRLRNSSSHSKNRSIFPPIMIIGLMKVFVEETNRLFS